MWIRDWGSVEERLDFLGLIKSGVYLLKGDRYMLVGGSGPWVVADLERQLQELRVDLDRIAYVWLSHSHYDHCGAVPYLKRRIPKIQVVASRGAAALLGMEKAVRNMQLFLREAAEATGAPPELGGISLDFEGFQVDRALSDGEIVDLGGGVRLCGIETPGHSRCSMVGYEPERKWLFPGDSLHIPSLVDDDPIFTASESFVVYQQSLQKLAQLEVFLCGWEHHGLRTGEDARHVIRNGLEYTTRYKLDVLDAVSRLGSPEAAAEQVSRDWLARAQFPFLPDRVMLHIARGIVTNAVDEPPV